MAETQSIRAATSAGYNQGHVVENTASYPVHRAVGVRPRDVISNSSQTLYALRVLRAKGMPDDALQVVFRSVIVGKLLYASCAWNGFVSNTDRK